MTAKATAGSIGKRIRELRKDRHWTQERLAALLSISQPHLSQLERGNGSFTAEQLLTILSHFNISLDEFAPARVPIGSQIHNALARHGAGHLAESSEILPTERLRSAAAAIREALVSADSARQIAAMAPVLVDHAGQLNLTKLRNEFAELGLENRFAWAIDCSLEAIKQVNAQTLPREWRVKYRRATTIIESVFSLWRIAPGPAPDPGTPAQYDVLDPDIVSEESLGEVLGNLSPIARRWRIATRLEVDDFARALRAAHGLD